MKIIAVCNYGKESVADLLIADNITNWAIGRLLRDTLNAKYCTTGNSPYYYRLEADNYKLYGGMSELV